jgi:DNA-binding NtrC family response regulator
MMITENDATLAEVVKKHIIFTLASCGGNRTHAARILGISLRCLRDKLRGYETAGVWITPARPSRSRTQLGGSAVCR